MSEGFLSRWSRRKLEGGDAEPAAPAREPEAAPPEAVPSVEADAEAKPPAPLPPVESLTPESDFTPFLQAEVDPAVKRQALKTLFSDPRFNVMDGLDVYIDDYSKPDPLPEGWLQKMNQVARLGLWRDPDAPAAKEPESAAADALAQAGATPAPPDPSNPPSDTAEAGKDSAKVPQSPAAG